MIHRLILTTLILAAWVGTSPAVEDLYDIGSDQTEWYTPWREGTDFAEHHFSPGYHPEDPDPFWDRVDKERPTVQGWVHDLWAIPKHLVWETPVNMGLNLKRSYGDTWSESDSGMEIARNVVVGVPNTAMIGVNGIWDSLSDGYSNLVQPIWPGVPFLVLPRAITSLARPVPGLYAAIDWIPKTTHAVGMPIRKLMMTAGDQLQKGTNFVYRSVTRPTQVPDHAARYWPGPQRAGYQPDLYVPSSPRSAAGRPVRPSSSGPRP